MTIKIEGISGGLTKKERAQIITLNPIKITGYVKETPKRQPGYEEAAEEKILKESALTAESLEPATEGSNINFITELDDGSRGFLKLFDPEATNITHHTPEEMERASYLVSQIMGFNLVPPTVVKNIPTRGLTHPKLGNDDGYLRKVFGERTSA